MSEQQLRCPQCGGVLPAGNPRFCIECGHAIRGSLENEAIVLPAATGPTVRLANARVEQAVVGGTIKLPTDAAIPPGMWLLDELPGADRVVALYAPLRAIVGGWSATTSDGWSKAGQAWAGQGAKDLVRFEIMREWFPAAGRANTTRLCVRIGASSFAEEGRTRRGFTYRVGSDPPMEVLEAYWRDIDGMRRDLPVPQIQLMAPPRIRRVSDYAETIRHMNAREADVWAKQGEVRGVFRFPETAQQRTPAGRGLVLPELFGGTALVRITGRMFPPFRVQIRRPLVVRAGEWRQLEQRIRADAATLGLDLGTDAAIEWWLDQQGHDGAVFERGSHPFAPVRTAVAFRRSQIVAVS